MRMKGGIDMFSDTLCFCPLSKIMVLARGATTSPRILADVQTIGPNSV